ATTPSRAGGGGGGGPGGPGEPGVGGVAGPPAGLGGPRTAARWGRLGGGRGAARPAATPTTDSRVLVTERQRKTAPREEAIDAGAPVVAGGELPEAARLQSETSLQPLGETDTHDLEDGGGRRRPGYRGVMREQPRDLRVALDVGERERRGVGERRPQRAAELADHEPPRDAQRVRQRVSRRDLVDDA